MKCYKIFLDQKHFLRAFKNKWSHCWQSYSTHTERNAADFKRDGGYLVRAELFAKGGIYDELIG